MNKRKRFYEGGKGEARDHRLGSEREGEGPSEKKRLINSFLY